MSSELVAYWEVSATNNIVVNIYGATYHILYTFPLSLYCYIMCPLQTAPSSHYKFTVEPLLTDHTFGQEKRVASQKSWSFTKGGRCMKGSVMFDGGGFSKGSTVIPLPLVCMQQRGVDKRQGVASLKHTLSPDMQRSLTGCINKAFQNVTRPLHSS